MRLKSILAISLSLIILLTLSSPVFAKPMKFDLSPSPYTAPNASGTVRIKISDDNSIELAFSLKVLPANLQLTEITFMDQYMDAFGILSPIEYIRVTIDETTSFKGLCRFTTSVTDLGGNSYSGTHSFRLEILDAGHYYYVYLPWTDFIFTFN